MKQHTDALKALIQSVPALASKTFVTVTPAGVAPPYVVIHPADGTDTQERLTAPRVAQHPRFTIHSVGSSADNCAAVAKAVKDKLIVGGRGVRVDVPGEKSFPAWWESPIPIQVDNDVTPPLIYHVAECGWSSNL